MWIVENLILLVFHLIFQIEENVLFFYSNWFFGFRLNLLCRLLFNQLLAMVEFIFERNVNSLCRGNKQVNSFFIFFWYPIQIFLKYIFVCFKVLYVKFRWGLLMSGFNLQNKKDSYKEDINKFSNLVKIIKPNCKVLKL